MERKVSESFDFIFTGTPTVSEVGAVTIGETKR